MILSIIVATGKKNEIGKDNGMLWHLPAELRRFKELTTGHTIIMGRKTYQSLPKGALPNRTNIVLTKDKNFKAPGCSVYSSLDEALLKLLNEEEVFIIGGKNVYEQTLPIADRLYLTRVHADFPDADTYFPEIDWQNWQQTYMETFPGDEKNSYSFTFYEYEHK